MHEKFERFQWQIIRLRVYKINYVEQALHAKYNLVQPYRLNIKFKCKAHWKCAEGSWNHIKITIRGLSRPSVLSRVILYLFISNLQHVSWYYSYSRHLCLSFCILFRTLYIEKSVTNKINDETLISNNYNNIFDVKNSNIFIIDKYILWKMLKVIYNWLNIMQKEIYKYITFVKKNINKIILYYVCLKTVDILLNYRQLWFQIKISS